MRTLDMARDIRRIAVDSFGELASIAPTDEDL